MEIKLIFLGAAGSVTGSRYLVEADKVRFLVDCGLYQERELRGRNWEPFPVPPQSLDAVLVTHAHLDHCGLLPKLVREGFRGPIYCTAATAEIAEITLLDSAELQQEDAELKRKRHERERRKGPYPAIPLYNRANAEGSFPLFSPVRYGETIDIGQGIEATFHDAGHVLGSSMIRIRAQQNGEERTLLFSGDIGRWGKPILRDPTLPTSHACSHQFGAASPPGGSAPVYTGALPGRLRRGRPITPYGRQSCVVPQTLHVVNALPTQCAQQHEALYGLPLLESLG